MILARVEAVRNIRSAVENKNMEKIEGNQKIGCKNSRKELEHCQIQS